MRKYEIARLLGKRYAYTSYLEVCTPTTGLTYSSVDKEQFSRRVRVMYLCPPGFSDGGQIDFSVESENGEELFEKLIRSGERFDVVFVDPYHTYSASLRDLVYGLQLVKPNGIVLVHDCFPPNEFAASPTFISGEWCGLTFAAYLDVILFKPEIQYFTIDSDYGCGVIYRAGEFPQFQYASKNSELIQQWRMLSLQEKYAFFEKHHHELLNLISTDEFQKHLSDGVIEDKLTYSISDDNQFNDNVLKKIAIEDAHIKADKEKFALRLKNTIMGTRLMSGLYRRVVMPLKKKL
jgi:hypothetical protein